MIYKVEPVTSPAPLDCGPTCLQMILGFYNIESDLNELSEACELTLTGTTAKKLMEVGKAYGLDMHAYSSSADNVYTLDRPAICWWKKRHFVIFCGIDELDRVVICDPDRGKFPISKELFATFFSEVYITNGVAGDIEPETLASRLRAAEEKHDMLIECLLEMADIVYA